LALLFCESQEFHQEQRFWLCSFAKAKSFTIGETLSFTNRVAVTSNRNAKNELLLTVFL